MWWAGRDDDLGRTKIGGGLPRERQRPRQPAVGDGGYGSKCRASLDERSKDR
jgi:hypothetical protein